MFKRSVKDHTLTTTSSWIPWVNYDFLGAKVEL